MPWAGGKIIGKVKGALAAKKATESATVGVPANLGDIMANSPYSGGSQPSVSWPRIQRMREAMKNGENLGPVKVSDEGRVVDGHHRAVAAQLEGINVSDVPWLDSPRKFSWRDIIVDPTDW